MKELIKQLIIKIPGGWNCKTLLDAFHAPLPVIWSSHRKILKYKGKYKGKRCFVIGNGPSLTAEDLNKIKGEYSFAANRIYNIFSQTGWRPTFYCVQDENVLLEMNKQDVINTTHASMATFIRLHGYAKIRDICNEFKQLIFVPIWLYTLKNSYRAPFSKRAEKYVFDGTTVTYMSLQLAAYMGFSEIYLLGVDNNMPFRWTRDGKIIENDLKLASHFYDGAENNTGEQAWLRRASYYDFVTGSYQTAENYSRKDGTFRIYNATRGGILEAFERVDLDEVMK